MSDIDYLIPSDNIIVLVWHYWQKVQSHSPHDLL